MSVVAHKRILFESKFDISEVVGDGKDKKNEVILDWFIDFSRKKNFHARGPKSKYTKKIVVSLRGAWKPRVVKNETKRSENYNV